LSLREYDGKAYVNFRMNEMTCHAWAGASEIKIKPGNYDCVESRRATLWNIFILC